MRNLLSTRLLALAAILIGAAHAQQRPPITGVSQLGIYASDIQATTLFFVHDLGATQGPDPRHPAGVRFYFNPLQFVEVQPLPPASTTNRFTEAAYTTPNAEAMRVYLAAHGVTVPPATTTVSDGSRIFDVQDPEGNRVQFVQPPTHPAPVPPNPLSTHIIHVGYLVHSAAAEDAFYRTVLGFRPYWHGGGKAGGTDWISLQVPDGTDWVEYMMVAGPEKTGIPPSMSQETAGVLDHFALGLPNMEQAVNLLTVGDRLTARHSPPQIGRDGKWQLNLYAPDGTRAELMEFQPSVPPCCSPFLLPSPVR